MKKEAIIKKIKNLLENFILNKVSGKEFEQSYMGLWKYIRDNKISYTSDIQTILDEIWGDVDAFVSDIILFRKLKQKSNYSKKEFDLIHIDEEELKKRVKVAIQRLNKLDT